MRGKVVAHFARRVRGCANVNHAVARFDKGRVLNEGLTLLRNRYGISSKIKSQQERERNSAPEEGNCMGLLFIGMLAGILIGHQLDAIGLDASTADISQRPAIED